MIHYISRFIAALALLATAQGAWAQETITGLTYNSAGGYYEINDAQDLASLATYVNGGNNASGKTFKQTADIDMQGVSYTPIGNDEDTYVFYGIYDGDGYVIKNISYSNTESHALSGLFGQVNGTVRNVNLKDCNFTGRNVGGIAGETDGSALIQNCTVLGGTITCTGNASGGHFGGIVGYFFNGTVDGCFTTTTYSGGGVTKGPVVGYDIGTVTNCYFVNAPYLATSSKGTQVTVYDISLGDGVTMSGNFRTVGKTVANTYYFGKSGDAVTLGHADRDGYILGYSSDDVTITDGAFTMPAADVAVAATFAPDPAHFSVNDAGTEYTIHTAAGWGVFCDALQDNDTYNRFSGKTVRLGDNIGSAENPVTRMAGSSGHEFTGTFDGDGKTLTVNYTNNNNDVRTAPFSYVNGATIQNLIVGGTISGTAYRAAGIVGETPGQTTITNCVSSVDISSGRYTGGISIGGLVTITGCVFNGKIVGTSLSGGFVGYSNTATAISNSLFDPQDGSSISGGTFYYNGGGDITPTNSYYTRALGTAQGKATRTVAAGADVTIEAVEITSGAVWYNVSGIVAYSSGGLYRDGNLYYGSGDQLSLTLSNSATGAPQGYQYDGYTASAGTLSGSTLTMPDQDVTISVNTADLALIDWATVNQGDLEDPYMIYNKDQLLLLAHRVNGTNGETANTYGGKYFKLGADITFDPNDLTLDEGQSNYEAIGGNIDGTDHYFRGQFDGANHTVSGIRIRKDDSYDADSNQGLFGCIYIGAEIYDVHLTDARITGYDKVGGIAGYNDEGYISGCSVTDSYITATGDYYGTICGSTTITDRLSQNYYHGCTVNGTAVTSGMGCNGADIADYNGALPAYRLALGANITTPPGTFAGQTGWLTPPPVDARLAPENGFTLAGNHYFASGYKFTPSSTLASGAAQGYTPRATLGGQLLDPYTPTGDADLLAGTAIAQFTVTADCDGKTLASTEAIYSTGQPVTVAYNNADGTPGEASAIALDGTETSLAAGTYFAGLENVNFDHTVNLNGNVTLILKDGCTMNVGTSSSRIDGMGITSPISGTNALTIYGQTAQTGNLNIYSTCNDDADYGSISVFGSVNMNGGNVTIRHYGDYANGIYANSLTVNGGNVDVKSDQISAFSMRNAITINGGNVIADGNSTGLLCTAGSVTINGGTVNATGKNCGILAGYGGGTITLGWTKPTDRITASSYYGTVQVASGKKLHNGSSFLYGTLGDPATALNGKTLRPAATATYTTADGTAATADAILLDASDNSLPAGNYLATGTLNYTHGITLNGNVTLILADNCHMNVGTSGERIEDRGIYGIDGNATLTIYSQSLGDDMGALNVYTTGENEALHSAAITINGGNVTADTEGYGSVALRSGTGAVTINNGNVTAHTAGADAVAIFAFSDFNYNGGTVSATATGTGTYIYAIWAHSGNYTFSWRTPADRITIGATGLYATDDDNYTATFARLFTDGSGNIYTGTLTDLSILAGKTLSATEEVTLAARLAPDGNYWTTFYCGSLPFDISGDACAYTATHAAGKLTLAKLGTDGKTIPTDCAVIIVGESDEVTLTVNTDDPAPEAPDGNVLKGKDYDTPLASLGAGTFYVLGNQNAHFGFHRYEGETMAARKAYVKLDSSNARSLDIVFDDATGITTTNYTNDTNSAGAWYTVNGVKLSGKPAAKGMYINNGKKVVIK